MGITTISKNGLGALLLSISQTLACGPSAEDYVEECREDPYCRVDELLGVKCFENEEYPEQSECYRVGPESEFYGVYQTRKWYPRKEGGELMYPYSCRVSENYVDVEKDLMVPIRSPLTSPMSYCDLLFENNQ